MKNCRRNTNSNSERKIIRWKMMGEQCACVMIIEVYGTLGPRVMRNCFSLE
jgi:hypothetical protein